MNREKVNTSNGRVLDSLLLPSIQTLSRFHCIKLSILMRIKTIKSIVLLYRKMRIFETLQDQRSNSIWTHSKKLSSLSSIQTSLKRSFKMNSRNMLKNTRTCTRRLNMLKNTQTCLRKFQMKGANLKSMTI